MDKTILSKWICSPRDYWKVGPIFIWKWLLLLLVGVAAGLVLWFFGLPSGLWRNSGSGIPAYRYDDPILQELSGVVQILDNQGQVRYEGEVAAGSYTGQGKVYDQDGFLVYEGPLVDGAYEGDGAKVYSDGKLIYEGTMAANLYEGEGRRTDPVSGEVSEGQFVAGIFEGEGRQYNADGVLIREGTFAQELLNGEGREYSDTGVLLREGTFRDGLLHGTGTQYTSSGVLEYEGEFNSGIYHGQGALYDTLDQVLVYEGEFVWGEATGTGRIYHPSGQLLYEGQVFEGQPRADAFLGLSLADVESAFKEHWILYSYEGITAFVYPYFHLMFVTEIPVQLVSPSEQEAKTEQERQELLEAIAAQTTQLPSPEEATDQEMVTEEPETAAAKSILVTAAAQPISDMELSQDTVKSDLLISEVLSYGAPLAGVPQPTSTLASGTHKAGWREWFSDYAAGETVVGAVALQTGPYIYEFTALTSVTPPDSEYYLASDRGVMSSTVHRDWKDNPVWYQSAVRRDEP